MSDNRPETPYYTWTVDGMEPNPRGAWIRAESLSLARAQRDVAERRLERLKRRITELFGQVSMVLDEDGVAHVAGVKEDQRG